MNEPLLQRLSTLVGVLSVVLLVAALALTTFQVTQPQAPFQAAEKLEDCITGTHYSCRNSISVRAYLDMGERLCNGTYDFARGDAYLPNTKVRLTKPRNSAGDMVSIEANTDERGFVRFDNIHFYNRNQEIKITWLEFPIYQGRTLNLCSNSRDEWTLKADTMRASVDFRAEMGGVPPTQPADSPTPVPTAVDTIIPTPPSCTFDFGKSPPERPLGFLSDCECGLDALDVRVDSHQCGDQEFIQFSWDRSGGVGQTAVAYRWAIYDKTPNEGQSPYVAGFSTGDLNQQVSKNASFTIPNDRRGHELEVWVRRVGYENQEDGTEQYCRSPVGKATVPACGVTPTATTAPTSTPTATPTPVGGPTGQSYQIDLWSGSVAGQYDCFIAWDPGKGPEQDNHNGAPKTYDDDGDQSDPGDRICDSRVQTGETRGLAFVSYTNLDDEAVNIKWQTHRCLDHGLDDRGGAVRTCETIDATGTYSREVNPGQKLTATWNVTNPTDTSGGNPSFDISGGVSPTVTPASISGQVTISNPSSRPLGTWTIVCIEDANGDRESDCDAHQNRASGDSEFNITHWDDGSTISEGAAVRVSAFVWYQDESLNKWFSVSDPQNSYTGALTRQNGRQATATVEGLQFSLSIPGEGESPPADQQGEDQQPTPEPSPLPTATPVPQTDSDVNDDGFVDGADVAAVVAAYNTLQGEADYNPAADFCGPTGDGADGKINAYEVSCLIRDWNPRR